MKPKQNQLNIFCICVEYNLYPVHRIVHHFIKYRKSYERKCISLLMSSDGLKVKPVQFENFQNITSVNDHKSLNHS